MPVELAGYHLEDALMLTRIHLGVLCAASSGVLSRLSMLLPDSMHTWLHVLVRLLRPVCGPCSYVK